MKIDEVLSQIGATRDVGGWTTRIKGVNKKKSDRYSITGKYLIDSLSGLEAGLYLDCDDTGKVLVSGGYKRNYTFFKITPELKIEIIQTLGCDSINASDYTTQFRDSIEKALKEEVILKFKKFTDEEILEEIKRRDAIVSFNRYKSSIKNTRAIRLE